MAEQLNAEGPGAPGVVTSARARAAAVIFAMLAAFAVLAFVLDLVGLDRSGPAKPPAKDFVAFWAAGSLALRGQAQALYDNGIIEAFERARVSMAPGYYAFYYPPPFLLLCIPLALLPYVPSLLLFEAGQAVLLWRLLRRILPQRWALPLILSFPGFLMNVLSGQNGGLTAVCFAGAALWLERRPLAAGACLGALVYKPQMALAVPIALFAARRWRAAFAAAATAAGICLISLVLLGSGPWKGFLVNAPAARGDLEHLAGKWHMMASLYADVRIAGGDVLFGYAAQALLALVALGLLAHLCWRRPGAGAEAAGLAATTLLVTPFLYDYDLAVMAVPLAWLAANATRLQPHAAEVVLLVALFLLPLGNAAIRAGLLAPLAPPFLLAALLLVLSRALRERPAHCPA